MSTRSAICIQRPTGEFTSIYCHSDGYYSYNGRRLMDSWHGYTRANALVSMGDCSSLGRAIGKKHDFDWRSKLGETVRHETKRLGIPRYCEEAIAIEQRLEAALPQIAEEWTLFYNRDRNQNEPMGVTVSTEAELLEWYEGMWCEYIYVWMHETWWTLERVVDEVDADGYEHMRETQNFIPLMTALKRDKDTMNDGPVKVGPTPYLAHRSARLRNEFLSSPEGARPVVTGGRRPLVI